MASFPRKKLEHSGSLVNPINAEHVNLILKLLKPVQFLVIASYRGTAFELPKHVLKSELCAMLRCQEIVRCQTRSYHFVSTRVDYF